MVVETTSSTTSGGLVNQLQQLSDLHESDEHILSDNRNTRCKLKVAPTEPRFSSSTSVPERRLLRIFEIETEHR